MDPNRAEAERLLGVAEKLLNQRDFLGSKEFAILAQESEPLLDGTDQILAVSDVLLAAEKRVNNNNQHDWYSILQIDRRSDDQDLIKKQYRRLALLLHPDKNKFPHADQAFTLVAEAWSVLSDSRKKYPYDNELSMYTRIDLSSSDSVQQGKLPVRRNDRSVNTSSRDNLRENNNTNNNININNNSDQRSRLSTFWTACPYCYILFEYPNVYENCCLKCQNCRRGFHAAAVPNLPPRVPGKEAYYCCWGVFPLGFKGGALENVPENVPKPASLFPNWMPPVSSSGNTGGESGAGGGGGGGVAVGPKVGSGGGDGNVQGERGEPRKRGRPRKYPVQS
ncbi:hypothetical protein LWI28_001736 [Acer negundo]|uniref:J domain-containing protein n=1 Tax=Acer negundo TaxID=4023 RepID=A0AAD5JS66_ACENE|nr:hypothetical protein LWI28_001736 [Acer negundo]KAK4851265.1 hypothetical protein QYF36_013702 [Acer negundo]